MTTTIYHNPRCSKSRATLELLRTRGVDATVVEYLKTPPSEEELRNILSLLNLRPRALMRQGESVYTELGLANPDLTDEQLIRAMVEHPVLIERPIVVTNGKAAIGRPPENILSIL